MVFGVVDESTSVDNEDRKAHEKLGVKVLRAQEKHEQEQVHYKLKIKNLKMKIDDLKKVIIGNILLPLRRAFGVNIFKINIGKININKF